MAGDERVRSLLGAAGFTNVRFDDVPTLFPAVDTVERTLPCGPPPKVGLRAGQALSLALALCQGRIRVDHLSDKGARPSLLDDTVPSGIASAWSDLLGAFTESRVEIIADVNDRRFEQSGDPV